MLIAAAIAATIQPRDIFDVRNFGAKGDGTTDDTKAFESAIAAAAKAPDYTRLVVSYAGSSSTYLIRPINLTSKFELFIEDNTTVVGIDDHTKWPVIPGAPSYGQGRDHKGPRYTSLIHGEHLHQVAIRGAGPHSVIDGRGPYWWKRHKAKPSVEKYTRGHLIELMYSTNVTIMSITMKDSPFWNTHIYDCDNVHIKGVNIIAPHDSPNTDGWDPDSSRNVIIEDSSYSGGDDCVAIKSGWDCFGIDYNKPTSNVIVRNVTCSGHIAGVAVGSEVSGGVSNVSIMNVTFLSANGAAHIKTGASRGGFVTNVSFVDLKVRPGVQIGAGILVDTTYGDKNPSCPKGWKPKALTRMDGPYTFYRIDASKAVVLDNPLHFYAPESGINISGVVMKDVYLPEAKPGHDDWKCAKVSGKVYNGTVTPWPPCEGFTIV